MMESFPSFSLYFLKKKNKCDEKEIDRGEFGGGELKT